jgi:S-adenosylmethionine:tRNA ribosyltransferase-isomerase
MRLSDFDFPFDPTLIADRPVEPRDQARLLVVPRSAGGLMHRHVHDLPELLEPGDVLVLNDTKVLPARLTGHKRPGGGLIEMVLIRDLGGGRWEALTKGRLRVGTVIDVAGADARATILEQTDAGTVMQFESAVPVAELLARVGDMPLPPYIKRKPSEEDRTWYQTVFARSAGAVAAPTAGLHFTPALLDRMRARGIIVAHITLHVGPGTFRPVRHERIVEHRMAAEWFDVPAETVTAVGTAKRAGRCVVAVGTTVARALESVADEAGHIEGGQGHTELFITPGYRFRVIDALLTNFHLPRTTLLMLVSAFAGHERLRTAYGAAVEARYRFYSYGDAMLVR